VTQLKAVAEVRFPDHVQVEILHLNHDFAHHIGDLAAYQHVLGNYGFMTGIGDWFFRQSAFPDAPDNTAEYFERYYDGADPASRRAWDSLIKHRAGLDAYLDSVIARYRMAEADIVGFTVLFAQTVASFALARRLKAANPRVTIVMGGVACSDDMGMEFAKQIAAVDYFFSGPGLVSFPEFLKNHLDGNQPSRGQPITGEELDINAELRLDYDSFLDSLDRTLPKGAVETVLLFETSRGCWWAAKQVCTFCGLNGPSLTYRAMRPERALAEFDTLFQYAPRCHFFSGADTILPSNYLKDVIPSLRPPSGVKIQYELRAQFREEDLAKLCAAGITVLQPGIESLSTATLKLMKKGISAFQNLRFLKACSKLPVEVGWNLLIFSPGESEATYEHYLHYMPLLTHLHPPQGVSLIGFVRYSDYFARAREFGLELQPEDHYRLTFPFDEAALERIALKFRDVNAPVERQSDWLQRLNLAADRWRTLWLNQARLCFVRDGGVTLIYDSRSGTPIRHALDATKQAVMELLELPRTASEIEAGLPQLPAADVERALAFFREHGLVFEENSRYLSLVIA
jgi:magnesium-protoporphyrin IX monomethyl ester (oxidative) cyclase